MTEPSEKRDGRRGELLANRYRLERLVAKGGMGRVYLATQLPLEREVAIKILSSKKNDDEFRQRFFLEASTCAKLVHRHIVTVHDYGETDDGELFMAMEFLKGLPLSKVISGAIRLPSDRVCAIALQVCRALRTAHDTGIVHRDLKPGNVMIMEDEDGGDFAKVLDFGLVKLYAEEDEEPAPDLTRSGTWLGSPRYMAPEQIRCQAVDPRTDIYSMGVIMFHMVAGRPPFVGPNNVEILEQHLRDPVPSIRDVVRDVDYAPELEVIIQRCMEKEAPDRYQSMDELLADLKAAHRLITGSSIHTDSGMPLRSDISVSQPIAPDLALVAQPSSTVSARPPPLPPVVSPSAPVREKMEDDTPPMVVVSKKQHPWRIYALVAAILFVLLGGFATARLFSTKRPKNAPIPALAEKKSKPSAKKPPAPPKPPVDVRLTSAPAGATVRLDGRVIGITPLSHRMPPGTLGQEKTFVLELDGYETSRLEAEVRETKLELHTSLTRIAEPVDVFEDVEEPPLEAPKKKRKARRRPRRTRRASPPPPPPPPPPKTPKVAEPRRKAVVEQVDRKPRLVDERRRSLVVDDEDDGSVDEGGVPVVD